MLGAFGLIGMLGAQKGPLSSAAVKKFYLKIAEDNSTILYNNKKFRYTSFQIIFKTFRRKGKLDAWY